MATIDSWIDLARNPKLATAEDDVTHIHTLKVSGGGGGSGSPGGSTTQVQYNNAGSFGGITGATSNGTTLTLVAPVLGTPASGNLANTAGYPTANLTGLGANVATLLATPSSANLRAALTDETGTGAAVFADTPTLVSPVLGAATGTSLALNGGTLGSFALALKGQALVEGLTTTSPGFYSQIVGDTSPRVRVGLNASDIASISFGSGAAGRDLFLERAAAATFRLGTSDTAAPVAQTVGVQNVVAGTTDTAGTALTINGSRGTGTGAGGSVVIQVAPAGSTGSSQNALASAITITSDKLVTLAGNITAVKGTYGNMSSGHYFTTNAGDFSWSTQGGIFSGGDGIIELLNAAGTAFDRIQLGGTTSSFPSLQRNGTSLRARLADDSANAAIITAGITCTIISASSTITGTVITGTDVVAAAGNIFSWTGRSRLQSPSDGVILLRNNAATDFTRLQFGGTTSSFPAIKRSSAVAAFRLADDSADCDISAARVIASNVVRLKGYTVATLPAGTQGDTAFVTDALVPVYAATVAAGGAVVQTVFYNGTNWIVM